MAWPPARLRRPALLIVGCGDIGTRVARLLAARWRLVAPIRDPAQRLPLRSLGVVPIDADLDFPATLTRLAGIASRVLYLAPPAPQGPIDSRAAHLLHALARRGGIDRLVYVSTTGVYGDAEGARIDETRAASPSTDRARRRVDAERRVRRFGRTFGTQVTILRAPGIYAVGRPGVRERIEQALPVLAQDDDVYTNHIHADDLARACIAALMRGMPQRAVNVVDDSELKMGDYFDLVADAIGRPRPPRLPHAELALRLSPVQMSFLGESRRLANTRMKRELRLELRYPTPAEGWRDAETSAVPQTS